MPWVRTVVHRAGPRRRIGCRGPAHCARGTVSAGCEAAYMDGMEFMRGRVYGADHEDAGPRAGRVYAHLVGGPLDGLLLDVTDRLDDMRVGVTLPTEIG